LQTSEPRKLTGIALRLHTQALKRCLVPISASVPRSDLATRVIRCLFPWTVHTYPGPIRGLLTVLGHRITWASVRHWQAERRPIPPWARAVLADYLRSRAAVALELAAELEAEPERKAGNRARPNDPPAPEQGG
jgi:hypothetical protein